MKPLQQGMNYKHKGNTPFRVDHTNNLAYGRNLDELNQFKLRGDFVYNGNYTEGD